MKTSGKSTLAQGTARSQHLDEQLLSCMASGGASNGDVDSLISLLRLGFFQKSGRHNKSAEGDGYGEEGASS